ncbi:UDP-galactopyranose mutase [Dongia deserti]|uniref:UDP-galactopyranose mutase n=1 Tax=Dongia deserti TaxID=2268030 RepID=UPI000E65DA01|nr:UDP-galactopyranose mutase [Dongia deserti]
MKAKAILVVGAGFAGAVYARELAEAGCHVEVIDRRAHIAGNAFDEVDATGIRRHAYGPHLFHTNSERVWAWVARFATFVPYQHRVSAWVPTIGRGVPLPVNRTTVNAVFGQSLSTPEDVGAFLARVAVPHPAPRNAAEYLNARIGVELTDLLFRPYSEKMWGMKLEQMAASVVQRVPIRDDDEDRYFPGDRYQGLPSDGYTELVRRMLDHPGIRVATGIAFAREMVRDYDFCFNSMAIDEYFGYALGALPYRSIRFHHRQEPISYRLGGTMQVNFTDDSRYTRQDDWSLLPGHVVRPGDVKTVTREEPCADTDNHMERYYPVKTSDGAPDALYRQYQDLAREEAKIQFIGRCGTYRYLDMDQVINQSLQGVRAWLARFGMAVVEHSPEDQRSFEGITT